MVEWRGGKGSLGSSTYSHGSALSVEDSECLFHCTFHHHYLITFSIGLSQSSSSEWQFVKPLIAQDFPSNATVHLGPSGSRCVRPRQEQLVGLFSIKMVKVLWKRGMRLVFRPADKAGAIETIITIIRWLNGNLVGRGGAGGGALRGESWTHTSDHCHRAHMYIKIVIMILNSDLHLHHNQSCKMSWIWHFGQLG